MKRILSWGALVLLSVAFYYAEYFFLVAVFLLGNAIYSFSEALFWVLIVCEGVTALGILVLLIIAASRAAVAGSQIVWRSKKGLRYKILGALIAVLNFVLFVALIAAKGRSVPNPLHMALVLLTMIAFGIAVLGRGFSVVSDYGQPPTKREVLEAKLRKLDEKERCEREAAHGQDA